MCQYEAVNDNLAAASRQAPDMRTQEIPRLIDHMPTWGTNSREGEEKAEDAAQEVHYTHVQHVGEVFQGVLRELVAAADRPRVHDELDDTNEGYEPARSVGGNEYPRHHERRHENADDPSPEDCVSRVGFEWVLDRQ